MKDFEISISNKSMTLDYFGVPWTVTLDYLDSTLQAGKIYYWTFLEIYIQERAISAWKMVASDALCSTIENAKRSECQGSRGLLVIRGSRFGEYPPRRFDTDSNVGIARYFYGTATLLRAMARGLAQDSGSQSETKVPVVHKGRTINVPIGASEYYRRFGGLLKIRILR